ncbi:Cytosolic acyl coenzyme A thioester hydrolase [Trichoplax sp. H2]|uniref:HotDog ACOT-type domain-containing protein n=1 Tax=Trichoplax adhaerens TaxID=10228 RepID=B3S1I7_TRIAD|nr:hypothetical protein TRIADDRAFT_58304 [Trichoplax adhaerens]EDV23232.1 hypothetical protein TRIADDRAFT_58304 [Trichoplax adhaerens]RDD44729.1 Cytosolic acyl coenzyme A thioester hydrolase [Trichoplax sp. H2]|eukprot:XP_002114142.1 hypothetical protein TRIADDRAFT_58304 [Trichoplax adhaerens]
MAEVAYVLSRMMMPDDANGLGNVHGGEVLKLMEEAGHIVATRHCNAGNYNNSCSPRVAVLARVEQMDFLKPMFISEVAHVTAEITYVSQQSIEVKINVYAENILKNDQRFTNRGILWYVAVKAVASTEYAVSTVPPLTYKDPQDEEDGRKRFEFQKRDRQASKELYKLYESGQPLVNDWNGSGIVADSTEKYTVKRSQSTLIHSILPSDCYSSKFSTGGSVMKLMDTAGALSAIRHSKTPCVTASIDAINFHHPMRQSNVITISGRVTFTSAKSMEVEVIVITEDLSTGKKHFSCSAFFNFVSVDSSGRVLPVPPLVLKTDSEKKRFESGKQRYSARKQRRLSRETTKN